MRTVTISAARVGCTLGPHRLHPINCTGSLRAEEGSTRIERMQLVLQEPTVAVHEPTFVTRTSTADKRYAKRIVGTNNAIHATKDTHYNQADPK